MTILGSLFTMSETPARTPAPDEDFWYKDVSGFKVPGGKYVGVDAAMRVVAATACVRCISDTLAMLPLIPYQRLAKEGKERATKLKIYNVLHSKPNAWQTPMEFKRGMQWNLLWRGNAYAQIILNLNGEVEELIPLNPDKMHVDQLPNRRLRYTYSLPEGGERVFQQEAIFHLRDHSDNGITGISRIKQHARAIALAIETENHSSNIFSSGGSKRLALEHPAKLSRDASINLRESFDAAYGGTAKTAVLEEGMKAAVIGMSAEDEQLIESRQFSIEEICRIFRVPPHKIQHLLRATFGNIEHQSLEFYTDTILPWMTLWEESCDRSLFLPEGVFCEFLADAVLRADIQTRYNAYHVAINDGWMNRNEVRAKENMNPQDGLEDHLQPVNMSIVGKGEDPAKAEADEMTFRREMVKTFATNPTAGSVIFNMTDGRKLLDEANVPTVPEAETGEPLLPVLASNGQAVSGEILKDTEGNIVGGTTERGNDDGKLNEGMGQDATGTSNEPPAGDALGNVGNPGTPDTEPVDPGEQTETGPVEDKTQPAGAAYSLAPLIEDAASRIANAEIGEIEKRIEQSRHKPEKFKRWLTEFYGHHADYCKKTLIPVFKAFNLDHERHAETTSLAITGSEPTRITDEKIFDFETWKANRTGVVTRIIKLVFWANDLCENPMKEFE